MALVEPSSAARRLSPTRARAGPCVSSPAGALALTRLLGLTAGKPDTLDFDLLLERVRTLATISDAYESLWLNPTGAGDCFLAGFAAGLARGLPLARAAGLGAWCGARAVEQVGVPRLDAGQARAAIRTFLPSR